MPAMNEPGSRVRIDAEDKGRGMTLGELREVVRLADELAVPDDARVRTATGFRSQLQWVEIGRTRS